MKKGKFYLHILAALLCLCLLLTACTGAKQRNRDEYSQEVQNLEKLCLVWGYVKYTHPVFLSGEKDWDAELISLIPQVRQAEDSEETNNILNEWLLSLGEIQYEDEKPVEKWSSAKKEDKVVIADTSWIFDKKYIGEELSSNMQPLTEPLPNVNRFRAPIDFSRGYYTGIFEPAMFYNEKLYEDMDYSDENYRLLGLFRVWNALEYYCPYLDILDEDWEDLLPEFIPQMLAESDQQSYDLTIAALMAKLQDVHVSFRNGDFLRKEFGEYLIDDVEWVSAEGEIVIVQIFDESSPFQIGDIVRKIDGVDIKDRIEHCKKYLSVPTDEKIENALQFWLLSSHSKTPEVTVIRNKKEMTVTPNLDENMEFLWSRYGVNNEDGKPKSYEIIEGNIGVINPDFMDLQMGASYANEVKWIEAMNALKDTDGLIVDYRQYPANSQYYLPTYLFEEPEVGLVTAMISEAVPGTFLKEPVYNFTSKPRAAYLYDKEVVVLIDEHSQSASEFAAMLVRNGEKVTLMGENTIGADGYCLILPIPGGNKVMYTACGIYTPDGGQTQRIGVSPDIEVKKTIEGIKEGRDEVKEAAVAYIQEQNAK